MRIYVSGGTPIDFAYAGGGSAPSARILYVSTNPSNLPVTMTASVTTPPGVSWLSAALNSGVLTVSVNPAGLPPMPTPYTGTVQLSAGGQTVSIAVNLTVYPAAQFSVTSSHTGNFAQGQSAATYSVVVSNASSTAATTASPTVIESPSSGLSLVSMAGTGWNCNTVPTCTRTDGDLLDPGASYPAVTVTMNLESNATSPQTNTATVSVPGLLDVAAYDSTVVTSQSCDVNSAGSFTVGDLQSIINAALGLGSSGNDLNSDGAVNVSDIQLVLNSVLSQICVV